MEQDSSVSKNAAFKHVARLIGGHPDIVRGWYYASLESDASAVSKGVSREEAVEIKKLKRQVRELREKELTIELLKDAHVFFATESSRLPKNL